MSYGLGVDLGTTYTAAAVGRGDVTDVVGLGDRAPEVPSVLFLRDDGELLVGESALRRGTAQPERMAREFKRWLGEEPSIVMGEREFPPPVLTGRLLRWVVQEVVARQGEPPDRLVLTFPATWGPHWQRKLAEAAASAEVGPVQTCPEPVAAALHFAAAERVPPDGTVAVYDLGGGTFDAAVLRHSAAGFELLGPAAGLEHVGGLDFDQVVFDHVTTALADELADLDPDDPDVTEGLVRLRRECSEAKEHLSGDTEAIVRVVLPGVQRRVRLTRPEFEDLIRPMVEETVRCLRRTLGSAGVVPEDLAAVVLVGGSARVPLVSELLGHDLGRPVTLSPSPKHAVALGAALLAGRPTAPVQDRAPARRSPVDTPVDAEGLPVVDPDTPAAEGEPGDDHHRGPAPVDRPRSGSRRRSRRDQTATTPERRLTASVAGTALAAVVLGTLGQALLEPDEADVLEVTRDRDQAVITGPVDAGQSLQLRPFGAPTVVRAREEDLVVDLGGAAAFAAGPLPATLDDREVLLDPAARLVPLPTALTGGLVLFVLAYAESFLRRVRRRRRARPVDVAGMTVVGALGGVAVLAAGWLLGPGWAVARLVTGDGGSLVLAGLVVALSAATAAGLVPLAAARAARRRRATP